MDGWRALKPGLSLEEAEIQERARDWTGDAELRCQAYKQMGNQRAERCVFKISWYQHVQEAAAGKRARSSTDPPYLRCGNVQWDCFFAEPLKPSKTNGNKLKGDCACICVCVQKREEERDTRAAWGEWQAWIFNASRRRRGDGYQRVSPATDPFTAAALLAQLDRDRALINWTGLSIQSLQSSTGLLSGSQCALFLWVMTSWNAIGSRAHTHTTVKSPPVCFDWPHKDSLLYWLANIAEHLPQCRA